MSCAALKMSSSADELVIQYQKYVHAIAKKLIASMGLPAENLDDMISAGYLGLVEAAGRFDPTLKTDFRAFAFHRIRGSIIDSIRANSDLSGRAYKLARAWSAIQSIEDNFNGEAEQDPDQLLANVLEFAASGALAFKFSMQDLEEEVAEAFGSDSGQEAKISALQEKQFLKNLVAQLPEKERFIIESYYYEEKSFTEITLLIGEHSKGWISRLHVKALSRLKRLIVSHRQAEYV